MVVDHLAVPMGVGMQVLVQMAMLVFMLQPMDGAAAALPVGVS